MDKVKLVLTILKKHHFWVLCGIVAICGLVSWWMGSTSLNAVAATNLSTVKQAHDKLSIQEITNPSFAEAVDKAHVELKGQAFKVWQDQYAAQQELLKWPEHFDKAKFTDLLARLKPGEPMDAKLRKYYASLIFPTAWERLQTIIDMRRPKTVDNAAAPAGAPMGQPFAADPSTVEWIGTVEWSLINRTELADRYFFNPSLTPSDTKVRLTQEDLWVFEDMAVVIADTNLVVSKQQGVTLDMGNAAVKRIESLDVAQWAIDAAQQDRPIVWLPGGSTLVETTASAGMGMGMGGGVTPTMPMPGDPSAAGAAPTAADQETFANTALKDGRYLKDDGQPLLASELDGTPPYAEFKQLFVRMKLVVDQRRIPELLTACANAPLPIEVRRLRIEALGGDAAAAGAAPFAGMPGGNMGGMGGRMGGLGGMRMGGDMKGGRFGDMMEGGAGARPAMPGLAAMAQQPGDGTVEPGPYDVSLELCGVVTLFNPPDEAKLGTGSAAEPGKKVSGIPTSPVLPPGKSGSGSFGGGLGGGLGGGRLGEN